MFSTQLKASESQYSVLMPDDAACCYAAADASLLPPLQYNSPPNNRFGDTNKTNLNGSIITLTMKNNHLIVETEERVPVINYRILVRAQVLLLIITVLIIYTNVQQTKAIISNVQYLRVFCVLRGKPAENCKKRKKKNNIILYIAWLHLCVRKQK